MCAVVKDRPGILELWPKVGSPTPRVWVLKQLLSLSLSFVFKQKSIPWVRFGLPPPFLSQFFVLSLSSSSSLFLVPKCVEGSEGNYLYNNSDTKKNNVLHQIEAKERAHHLRIFVDSPLQPSPVYIFLPSSSRMDGLVVSSFCVWSLIFFLLFVPLDLLFSAHFFSRSFFGFLFSHVVCVDFCFLLLSFIFLLHIFFSFGAATTTITFTFNLSILLGLHSTFEGETWSQNCGSVAVFLQSCYIFL